MPKYEIKYNFNGEGTMVVIAKDKEEAENIFYDGGYTESDNEGGENYCIDSVKEIKP